MVEERHYVRGHGGRRTSLCSRAWVVEERRYVRGHGW